MLVLSGVLATAAVASHPASSHARGRMHAAVKRSPLMPPPVRRGHFRLRSARVSSLGPWAKATVAPTGAAKRRLDPVLTIFKRDRSHGWRVVTLGTSEVGCSHPRLPRAVRRDLHLICPPGSLSRPAAGAGPAKATRARCRPVRAGGHGSATAVHPHNLGCAKARRLLRRWLHRGFPHHLISWYCDMSTPVKLCAFGNGGGAPYVRFRLHR